MPQAARADMERAQEAWRPARQAVAHARRLFLAEDLGGAESEVRRGLAVTPMTVGPVAETANRNPDATRLLGRILARQGKYREALPMLLVGQRNVVRSRDDPDIAIAYCRLGDYTNARRYCSGGGIMPTLTRSTRSGADLPGTASLRSLEASALLARGLNALGETRRMHAHEDFLAAERLVPANAFVAYVLGRSFVYDVKNGGEAWKRFKLVAAKGHEPIRTEALRQLEGLKAWFRIHPEEAPAGYVANAK
jgi:tetratricopeptide (TPR) repeat protein